MIRIDPANYTIEDEIDVHGTEDIYYKTSKGYIPIAYCYPTEKRAEVDAALGLLRKAKAHFREVEANVFYRILPALRAK